MWPYRLSPWRAALGRDPFALQHEMEGIQMSAQKIVAIVDRIAMTGVTAVLLAALPLSAVLFVAHSV